LENSFICFAYAFSGSKVVVLVQNKGESNLKANISVENIPEELEVPKQRSKMVRIITLQLFL